MSPELRQLAAADVEEAVAQRIVSYADGGVEAELREALTTRQAAGQLWGAYDGDRLLGHFRMRAGEHWFGGRLVPCQQISAVVVPPEHRGRGVARRMMVHAIRHGAAEGLGLSVLFPATTRLYRSLGWEHAGVLRRWRLTARDAAAGGRAVGEPLRRLGATGDAEADWAAVRRCHDLLGRWRGGQWLRPEDWWADLRDEPFAYVLDAEDGADVEAYVLASHSRSPGDWQHTVGVEDWAATTPRGLRAVLAFIAGGGTFAKDVTFRDTDPPLLSALLPEQDVAQVGGLDWMVRPLDLPAAVAARGFPPGLRLGVTLAVADPVVGDGCWRLDVADGRGALTPATSADLHLDVRAVGPLFTGYADPHRLRLVGLLDGDADAAAALAAAFAGPVPTLVDFF